MIFLFESQMS